MDETMTLEELITKLQEIAEKCEPSLTYTDLEGVRLYQVHGGVYKVSLDMVDDEY